MIEKTITITSNNSIHSIAVEDETHKNTDSSKTGVQLRAQGVKHATGPHAVQSVACPPYTPMERVASEKTQRILQLHESTHEMLGR